MNESTLSQLPIFDGHNDTLLHMANLSEEEQDWSFFKRNETGHIDLPRAREGGMHGGFFAILAPPGRGDGDTLGRGGIRRSKEGYSIPMAPAIGFKEAQEYTKAVMELLFELERESDGELFVARDIEALRSGMEGGRFGCVLHFEGAEAIDEDLEWLDGFYASGLRSLGIVWSRPNAFGTGVPFCYPGHPDQGPGLTEAGFRLVRACNELGVMLDLAHLNAAGFWDVAKQTTRPLVVTHACCHAICPTARNLTDRQIDAIGESGGVIGINFFVGDVRADGRFDQDTPLTDIVRHFVYVAERIGVEHVAFGSDFDGARMAHELRDVAGLPKLVEALRAAGFDDEELRLMGCENWLRVLEKSWA